MEPDLVNRRNTPSASEESTGHARGNSTKPDSAIQIPRFTGAVLAGGRSLRMGQDKTRLTVAGEPLLTRQIRLLSECGAQEILVSQHPDRPLTLPERLTPPTPRLVLDFPGELGPLGGLGAILAAAKTDLVLVVAVDLPHMTVSFLRRLLTLSTDGVGVVCRSSRGLEPLLSVYPRRALVAIEFAIAHRQLSCQRMAAIGLKERWLTEFKPQTDALINLTNWNVPADCEFFL